MLYTLKFLGIDTNETLSALKPFKKKDGSFENILVENEREIVEDLMKTIDCFENEFQLPCLGLKINKESIFELIFKDPDDESELTFCGFKIKNIDKLRAFFRDNEVPIIAAIQEIEENEWRIVHETIYELDAVIH